MKMPNLITDEKGKLTKSRDIPFEPLDSKKELLSAVEELLLKALWTGNEGQEWTFSDDLFSRFSRAVSIARKEDN